jgi:excisionase family DNA binding protein
MPERLLSPKELAAWCGVPVATVYRWNMQGTGPPARRCGKHVRYRESDCERWLDQETGEGPGSQRIRRAG